MSIVLTVYSTYAFREYYLPVLHDEDYTIAVDPELFGMPTGVNLQLETVGTIWYLKNPDGMLFTNQGKLFIQSRLKENAFFRIGPSAKEVWAAIIVSEKENTIRSFDKISLRAYPYITIGRQSDNLICYNFENYITEHHAVICTTASGSILKDTSQNGTFVGGRRIKKEKLLVAGDVIKIYGLTIVFLGDMIAVDADAPGLVMKAQKLSEGQEPYGAPQYAGKKAATRRQQLKRSPRIVGELHTEPFEIEAPPPLQQQRKQPLLLTIGPSFTMIIPMMLGSIITLTSSSGSARSYTGLVVVGAAGAFAIMWALIRLSNSKKMEREDKLLRERQYGLYLSRIEEELKSQTDYNRTVLLERYPHVKECSLYPWKKQKLWNRNYTHADFLFTRLGIGALPFQAPITVPKERFSLINDELAERPRAIKDTYETIHDVPVGVDLLKKPLLGIFGSSGKERVIGVARAMAMQLATNNCYTDVRMVFLYGEDEQAEWAFARWLPHAWSEDRKVRFIACNKTEASDILYVLAETLRNRLEAGNSVGASESVHKPYYVVFLSDPSLVEAEPVAKYLFSREHNLGVSVVVLSKSYEDLPNNCTDLIQADDEFCGVYDVETMDANREKIQFDAIEPLEAEKTAREMSNIYVNDTESGGEIPNSLTFLDMYNVKTLEELNVLERWRKNRTYENMRALIGRRAGGSDVYLDIHEKYHGPHGLVAGTTGSGKSETLQTFMLSLAMNFSPLDVGFFVIDFKGGGMANLFSSLPHMIGQITNLSGNAVRRAMVSIKSEIKRRQRIFSEFDVNHLDKYSRLVKTMEATIPIPHLLIIIDEFAELKREEPEFMKELISVAQVGRSLGVHLILATQKPAGVVDDSIWSNSRFKLCLRVQDKQDSNDMLKKPDAAYITQAGRCYLQVGNDELFELFQSGWSGASYDVDALDLHTEAASLLTLSGKKTEGKRRRLEIKEAKRVKWLTLLIRSVFQAASRISAGGSGAADNLPPDVNCPPRSGQSKKGPCRKERESNELTTQLKRRQFCFELYTLIIVEEYEVVNVHLRFADGFRFVPSQAFSLENSKEILRHSVVVAISTS